MAEIKVTIGADAEQTKASPARIRLHYPGVQFGKQVGKVGETQILVTRGLLDVQIGEFAELVQHRPQLFRGEGVIVAICRGHRRETDFVKAKLPQMPEGLLYRRDAAGESGAGRNRTRLMVLEQRTYARLDRVIGTSAAFIEQPHIVIVLRPVDA